MDTEKLPEVHDITVTCYSGHMYAEEPRSFRWEGVEYEVTEIIKGWREPERECFLVRTGGNKTFKICYNRANAKWSLVEVVRR